VHQGLTAKIWRPLFEGDIDTIPAPQGEKDGARCRFWWRISITATTWPTACPRFSGTNEDRRKTLPLQAHGSLQQDKNYKLFSFSGLKAHRHYGAGARDIIAVAGVEGITIGETITSAVDPGRCRDVIDEPTIAMLFTINTSPFCGREGNYVTSR